jgi:hypothetical protein
MMATAPRMRCERLHADISVATCLARRKNIRDYAGRRNLRALDQFMAGGKVFDPGCLECKQGAAVELAQSANPSPSSLYIGAKMDNKTAAPPTRACSGCGENLPKNRFYKAGQTQAGQPILDTKCKKCRNRLSYQARKKRLVRYSLPAAAAIDAPSGSGSPPPLSAPRIRIVMSIDCADLIEAVRKIMNQ